jgi:hypothetical protein
MVLPSSSRSGCHSQLISFSVQSSTFFQCILAHSLDDLICLLKRGIQGPQSPSDQAGPIISHQKILHVETLSKEELESPIWCYRAKLLPGERYVLFQRFTNVGAFSRTVSYRNTLGSTPIPTSWTLLQKSPKGDPQLLPWAPVCCTKIEPSKPRTQCFPP